MDRFEAKLAGEPDIDHWSSYVGQGAVRFILSFDPQPASPNIGQIVIVDQDIEARESLRAKLKAWPGRSSPGLDIYVNLLAIGPPAGRPVQYRSADPTSRRCASWRRSSRPSSATHP